MPALLWDIRFAFSGATSPTLTRVDIHSVAGADGRDPMNRMPQSGVEVLYDDAAAGRWKSLAANGGTAAAPATLDGFIDTLDDLRELVYSHRDAIHLAVAPAGRDGPPGEANRVAVDYIELRVSYRRP